MPRVAYVCDPKAYRDHYGHGIPVYSGDIIQHGYGGLGGIISGLFRRTIPLLARTILPLIKHTARKAGKTLMRSGVDVVKDVILNKKDLKQSLKRHAKSGLEELLGDLATSPRKQQRGEGYKCKLKRQRKKRSKQARKDIFE